jgi:hypothetical protein
MNRILASFAATVWTRRRHLHYLAKEYLDRLMVTHAVNYRRKLRHFQRGVELY